jgi:hypothetical protein
VALLSNGWTVQTPCDARQQATGALDTAEGALNVTAVSSTATRPGRRWPPSTAWERVGTAREPSGTHEFTGLADRFTLLEKRHERLQQMAGVRTLAAIRVEKSLSQSSTARTE